MEPEVVEVWKRDALGRVELVQSDGLRAVRRVAAGGRIPFSRSLARALLRREGRALRALEGVPGVARVLAQSADGGALLRSFLPGTPLCLASALPRDFFERLEELVCALHERGVCHNDLHKEGNVLVGEDGYPNLVDFQLASWHPRRGRSFAVRAREDLRHVWKHRSHYFRALGVPDPLSEAPQRSFLAESWRRFGKPLYGRIKRSAWLRREFASGEARRAQDGPWPSWSAPVGPRATPARSSPAAPSRPR